MSETIRSTVLKLIPWMPRSLAVRLVPQDHIWSRADDHKVANLNSEASSRLLIGGMNTAGQAKRWADALTQTQGVYATSLGKMSESAMNFPADAVPSQAAMLHSPTWSMRQSRQILDNATHIILESGTPIMGTLFGRDTRREVRAMQEAGIQVAAMSHGSDVRIPSRHAELHSHSPFKQDLNGLTAALETKSVQINQLLDDLELPEFVSTPDLITYRPYAIWVPTLHNRPLWEQADRMRRSESRRRGPLPLVGHIPSRAALKGTQAIRESLSRLHEQGVIEYREFQNLSPEGVAREVAQVDVLVDQVGMGLYGVASVEAMAIGVPVVAELGEQTRNRVLSLTGMEVPIAEGTVATIGDVVRDLVANPGTLREMSDRGREYVRRVHSPEFAAYQLSQGLKLVGSGANRMRSDSLRGEDSDSLEASNTPIEIQEPIPDPSLSVGNGKRKPSLLLISYSDVSRDARVLKQIRTLTGTFNVTVCGHGEVFSTPAELLLFGCAKSVPNDRIRAALLHLRQYGLASRFEADNLAAREILRGRHFDAVITNDLEPLGLAIELFGRARVHADLHEYYPGIQDHDPAWVRLRQPYYRWMLANQAARVRSTTTVSEEIAKRYEEEFGFKPEVVENALPFISIDPTPVHEPVRLVHSGAALPNRRIESMMQAVTKTSARVTFDLFLTGTGTEYYRRLESLSESLGSSITLRPPVKPEALVSTLNDYDIGMFLLPPTTTNYALALPNKFFDFVQARLGVIVGPTDAMAQRVKQYDLGAVTRDFSEEALVEVLDELDKDRVATWKQNSSLAAFELDVTPMLDVWRRSVEQICRKPTVNRFSNDGK